MSERFRLKGLCVCGHDPEEDPSEDCERCWLVTQVLDLRMEAVEDEDSMSMLRAELARVREERDRCLAAMASAARAIAAYDPSTMTKTDVHLIGVHLVNAIRSIDARGGGAP
jgi:hypothetical protein